MKNHVFLLLIALLLTGCGSDKFTVKRRIIKVYENDRVKVLVADNNDIIETFKDKKGKKCKEIVLGKKYKFKVYPVSDLFQGCYLNPLIFWIMIQLPLNMPDILLLLNSKITVLKIIY